MMGMSDDKPSAAVERADSGTEAWRDAELQQRSATPEHSDFYDLAGSMVTTLRALGPLAATLSEQVRDYGRTRVLRDDEDLPPAERIAEAGRLLDELGRRLADAEHLANEFWSTIGHVGVEVAL